MNWFQKLYYRFRPNYLVTIDMGGDWSYHCKCVSWLHEHYGLEQNGWWNYNLHINYFEIGVDWSGVVTYIFKREKDAVAFKITWTK